MCWANCWFSGGQGSSHSTESSQASQDTIPRYQTYHRHPHGTGYMVLKDEQIYEHKAQRITGSK